MKVQQGTQQRSFMQAVNSPNDGNSRRCRAAQGIYPNQLSGAPLQSQQDIWLPADATAWRAQAGSPAPTDRACPPFPLKVRLNAIGIQCQLP